MKKIIYLLPLLLIGNLARAAFGLEQLGKALITFSLGLVALPFIVGGLAVIFTKKRKGRAFLIGFLVTAAILAIWFFASASSAS